MKFSKNGIVVFLALLIFGIVAGLQFKAIQEKMINNTLAEIQTKKFKTVQLIKEEIKISLNSKVKITNLEKENQAIYLFYSTQDKNGVFKKINEKYKRALLYAGMTDVIGSGIVVTLNDANVSLKNRANQNSNWFVIHDKDIIRVINELRKGGAEAISINGERVVSTSAQVCAGTTVMINGKKYITPYEIKAIGNSRMLYDFIVNSTIYQELKDFSLPITIKSDDNIFINKFLLNKQNGGD